MIAKLYKRLIQKYINLLGVNDFKWGYFLLLKR